MPGVHWMRRGLGFALVISLCWTLPGAAAAKSRTLTLRFGPVSLSGYETGTGTNNTRAPKLDGYVTRMHAHLVDRNGKPIPQQRVMLHHVFFTNQSRAGRGDCARAHTETFYGTGEEDQEISFPPGYGYRVKRTDRWKVGWMFMNHRHSDDRVYLQYTVTVSDNPQTQAGDAVLDQRQLRAQQDLQRAGRRRPRRTATRAPGRCPRAAGSWPPARTPTAAR